MFVFKSEKRFDPTAVDDHQFKIKLRCGRVMADNIAYAKFRRTLLI